MPPSNDDRGKKVRPGYNYHGVKMQAVARMSRFPSVLNVSKTLGALTNVEAFSIGGNIILYRNGKDHISWHSDDTQGEEKICCLVAVCPDIEATGNRMRLPDPAGGDPFYTNCARPLRIKRKLPKHGNLTLEQDDEFIELWVGAGDAYEMDSKYTWSKKTAFISSGRQLFR
jgi:hypothetical protein